MSEKSGVFDVRVLSVDPVADGVMAVTFARTDGTGLPSWQPGAHVDVHLPNGVVRHYSLSSDPAEESVWRIGVLREVAGRGGSAWLHDNIVVGSELCVGMPRNNFELKAGAPSYRFVAGGIGITPLLPMIARVAATGAEWRLLYGGRTRESMAFVSELTIHGDRVDVRPQDEFGLLDLAGYLRDPKPGELVYACGPAPMLTAIEAAAAAWPEGAVHMERFVPLDVDTSDDTPFEVEFVVSGVTAMVGADETILEVAERLRVPVESSCREGTCGTCETEISEGRAAHRDAILSAAEREANESMMVCVSRAERGCTLLRLAV